MLTGLRASDAATLQRLCGADQRLYLRIGALLQARLALTEPALAEAVGSPALTKALMDRRLRDCDAAGFTALLADCGAADTGLVLVADPSLVEAGWRVVAVDDELGNPLLAADERQAVLVSRDRDQPMTGLLASLSPALRAPVEGLLQAGADDQRAAALEQLRYAAPPLPVVSELMPMLLADAADVVRERAIGLLVASGAHVAVVDLIRALQRNDQAPLARLADTISGLNDLQLDVAVSALLAAFGRGLSNQSLVGVCERFAGHLARHRGLDRLLDMLLPTRLSLVSLVRALQLVDAPRVNALLTRALGQGPEADAQIIVLLAGPGQEADGRLLERGIDLLLSSQEAPLERMALAGALRRLDQRRELAGRIAAHGMRIAQSRDTTVYWLLADLCRDGAVDAALADELAGLVRKLLREASGPHLVAIVEQHLPALIPASGPVRASLVEPLVEIVGRFRDQRSRDLVATALVAIGPAAAAPLWQALEDHPHRDVRLLAAVALPEVLRPADAAAAGAAVDRLLAALGKAGSAEERCELCTAAARLAAEPVLSGDGAPLARVDAVASRLGEDAIEALGHLAAAPAIDPGRRAQVLESMLAALLAELPDAPMQQTVDPATQDTTFVLDSRLGTHTESVPRLLSAVQRIGRSPHLPPQLLRRLVDRLCHQWQLVSSWSVVWGPGNTQELGRVLGALAERPDFPGPLRLRICEALLPRIGQLSVARSLARVFAAADGSFLSDLAGKATDKLVKLAAGKHFADDEQEELIETLIDFLAVPHLGGDGESLRRRLVGLLVASRNRVGNRTKVRLRTVMAGLASDLQQRLEWA